VKHTERMAGALVLVFMAGPLFFHGIGLHQVAPVGWLGVALTAAAWLLIRKERYILASVVFQLAFDTNSFGYTWFLGRDSWVVLGLFTPLVVTLPILKDAPAWARVGVVVSRVVLIAIGSQLPILGVLDPPPSDLLLAVARLGSVTTAGTIVGLALLFHQRTVNQRETELAASATQMGDVLVHKRKTEEKLQLAMWEADRADRARVAFLGTVSHELRTPLAMILGLTEALLEEAQARENRDLQGDLEEMMMAERRLHEAVEALLEVAQIDKSAQPTSTSPISAEKFLQEIRGGYKQASKEAELRFELRPMPGDLVIDRSRVMRVLRELVDNAVRHAETTVRLGVRRIQSGGARRAMLQFVVTDDGPGMTGLPAMESGETLLQVGATDSALRPPKGIGLFLARRLVQQMGGSLVLDDERPAGTEISVFVPEGISEKLNVLVVDDMQVNGEVLLRRLSELGAEGRWVGSGQEALDVLRAGQQFDLLLLDLHMPGMNGLETAQLLRALGSRCPKRIVAVTADTTEETRARCAGAGLEEVLHKPVRVEQLRTTLRGPSVTHPGLRPSGGLGRVDLEVLSSLAGELDDPEFVSDMVTWFASSARARITEGRTAAESGDGETMHRAAHSLKGLAGTVGALRLQMVARDLEMSSNDLRGANAAWTEAEQELGAVLDTLHRQWNSEVSA